MTSQGSAHGRFQRAIRDRHLRRASMAARELGTVSLAEALALTLLTAELDDDRWPRAAARWLGRFIVESPAMTISEAGQRVLDHTRGNLKATQKLLGHSSISTTADIYVDWDIDQLAETLREMLESES